MATKSCVALIDYLFYDLNFSTIIIRCAIDNLRSKLIPERLQFTLEGVEDPKHPCMEGPAPLYVYSMRRTRWTRVHGSDLGHGNGTSGDQNKTETLLLPACDEDSTSIAWRYHY